MGGYEQAIQLCYYPPTHTRALVQLLGFCYVYHHHSDHAQYLLFPFAAFFTRVPFCHRHQDPTPLLLLLLLLLLLTLLMLSCA